MPMNLPRFLCNFLPRNLLSEGKIKRNLLKFQRNIIV